MRRATLLLLVPVLVVACAGAAQAQGKDPFRPPPAAGDALEGSTDLGQPSSGPPAGSPAQPGDGLARTGQDVGSQLGLGIILLLLGGAFRLTERGVGLSGWGG